MNALESLPVIPLRDVVVFPYMMFPFAIGRPSSGRALEHALGRDKRIFLAAQRDAAVDDPQPSDIFTMGSVATIVQSLKLPDGNTKALVEGLDRGIAVEWKHDHGFHCAFVKVVEKHKEAGADAESTMSRVVSLFEQYVKLSNDLGYDAMMPVARVADSGKLADTIAAHLRIAITEKQELLETTDSIERLRQIGGILDRETDQLERAHRIEARVRRHIRQKDMRYRERVRGRIIRREIDDLERLLGKQGTSEEDLAKIREELKHLATIATTKPPRRRVKAQPAYGTPATLRRPAHPFLDVAGLETNSQTTEPKEADARQMFGTTSSVAPPWWPVVRSGFWGGLLGGFLGGVLLVGMKWLFAR